MLKAIIFDMDGVLIDSEPVHLEANKRLMEKLGLKFDKDYYMQFIGSTVDYMWDKMKKDYGITLPDDELMAISDDFVREINGDGGYPIMEGAEQLIHKLHKAGLKLAVASSSGMERIISSVNRLNASQEINCIVSGQELRKPKPKPDIFLKVAEELNVLPEECIVIEDSLNGMMAAKNAGMICVMYENQSLGVCDSSYADYIIQSFVGIDDSFFNMVYAHTKGEP